jgi:hypothetical protein
MWNRLSPTRPTQSDLAEIYRDYMDPDSSVFGGSPKDLVDTERRTGRMIASITAAGFTVEEHTYPRDGHYSTQQWLDFAFTHSNHLVLAAGKASELRARLAERIGSRGVSVGGDALLILATRTQGSG